MTSQKPTIAIVEDEAVLREELAFQLRHFGFAVETFESATQLYRRLAVGQFDAVVLDIGLHGEDGLSICSYLREHDKQIGIVFVTARALRDDRLVGLQAGADAYLTKPVDIDELHLLLKRLCERANSAGSPAPEAATLGDGEWRLDTDSEFLYVPGNLRVRLTLNELRLLGVMLEKPGKVVGGQELALALGLLPDEYNKHRVEVIISRLRDKVQRETGVILPVKSKRGVGYAFQP